MDNTNTLTSNIKIIWIGLSWINAVNRMIEWGLEWPEFITLHTDKETLKNPLTNIKINMFNRTTFPSIDSFSCFSLTVTLAPCPVSHCAADRPDRPRPMTRALFPTYSTWVSAPWAGNGRSVFHRKYWASLKFARSDQRQSTGSRCAEDWPCAETTVPGTSS